jgi:hypothetical protein
MRIARGRGRFRGAGLVERRRNGISPRTIGRIEPPRGFRQHGPMGVPAGSLGRCGLRPCGWVSGAPRQSGRRTHRLSRVVRGAGCGTRLIPGAADFGRRGRPPPRRGGKVRRLRFGFRPAHHCRGRFRDRVAAIRSGALCEVRVRRGRGGGGLDVVRRAYVRRLRGSRGRARDVSRARDGGRAPIRDHPRRGARLRASGGSRGQTGCRIPGGFARQDGNHALRRGAVRRVRRRSADPVPALRCRRG